MKGTIRILPRWRATSRLLERQCSGTLLCMQIINGKALADALRAEVATQVAALPKAPVLGVLLVGDDAASQTYVGLKQKAAAAAGIETDVRHLPADISDEALLEIIRAWNADARVNGILLQLPLPPGHDVDALIAAIEPLKDVDGFHPENVRALLASEAVILSPVHEGILRLIASTGMDVRQKRVALIVNSEIFAQPLEYILKRAGLFVDRMTPDELDKSALRQDDVVITAVGRPSSLRGGMVKDDAVVIDVGTTRLPNGKTSGDADFDSFEQKPGWITPVPGGVGPMTVALLLKNVVELAKRQQASTS